MRSKIPIPRSPRNIGYKPDTQKGRGLIWLGRGIWALAGVCATAFVAFVSQGPDAIRKIPEIPSAVFESASKTWDDYLIARHLSKTWEIVPSPDAPVSVLIPIKLVIHSKDGIFLGELYSPAIRKWTVFDMALVEGQIVGAVLRLNVFDFKFGERKEFAKIEVRFQEPPTDGVTDHMPALVLDKLLATTTWQVGSALPLKFALREAAN